LFWIFDSDGAWGFLYCVHLEKASQIAQALNGSENENDEPSTLTSTIPEELIS
jgi:hypothetical protein